MKSISLLGLPLLFLACAQTAKQPPEQASPPPEVRVLNASTSMTAKKGLPLQGDVQFRQEESRVIVSVHFTGVKSGKHGFHIHESGDCSAADFASAGGHYNPHAHNHGALNSTESHAGDLGNLMVPRSGEVHTEVILANAQLKDFVGKAVILHEKADDFKTQPTGDAGGRIACGVIQAK